MLVFTFDAEDRVSQPLIVEMTAVTLNAADDEIVVTWTGPRNRNDLVTFATTGGNAIRRECYAYVGTSKVSTVTVLAPRDAAQYDIIYLSGGRVIGRRPVEIIPVSMAIDAADEVQALLELEIT